MTKISEIQAAQGFRDRALAYAEESLAIDERLAAMDRTNVTWQKDVRVSRALVERLRGSG